MVGPLLYHEMLLGSRRSRDHAFRWVYAVWLLATLGWCMSFDWLLHGAGTPYSPFVCRRFVEFFIPQHFILLLLVTPAFVASAVTEEKTKGTLQYLLTTDLAPLHIIVGKLVGRILQVCTLSLTGLPLLAMLGPQGGLEPALLLGMAAVTILVAAGTASATFLAAVWARQTRDAVLGLYCVGIVAATAVWRFGGPLSSLNPIALLDPVAESGGAESVRLLGRQLLLGVLAWGGLMVTCLALAAWRLRPAYIRQLEAAGRPGKRLWWRVVRPAVGTEPIRWKEQHVEGLRIAAVDAQGPAWLGIAVTMTATVLSSCTILYLHRKGTVTADELLGKALHLHFLDLAGDIDWSGTSEAFLAQAALAMNVFGLLVAIRCSGSVSGERERQTWDALLLTPLTVADLIRGKLWGISRVGYLYLAAYAVPALLLSMLGGPAATIWTVLYVGETLLAMYYLGAVGMWCSVPQSTWRSLLATLVWAYVVAIAIFVCLSPFVLIVSGILYAMLSLMASHLGINAGSVVGNFATFFSALLLATCIGLVVLFWVAARLFLPGAQQWIADRDAPGTGRTIRRSRGAGAAHVLSASDCSPIQVCTTSKLPAVFVLFTIRWSRGWEGIASGSPARQRPHSLLAL